MPTVPPPDISPGALAKITISYTVAGDSRATVFHADNALTDAAMSTLAASIRDAIVAIVSDQVHNISATVERPNGTSTGTPTTGQNVSGTRGSALGMAVSPLGWKLMYRDTRGKVTSHLVHGIKLDEMGVQGNVLTIAMPSFAANLTTAIVNNTLTKSGYTVIGTVGARVSWKRDKASGGHGRRLTVRRAEKFLLRHGVSTIPANP